MSVRPPQTIEDFKKILDSISELQSNPYCDHLMFMALVDKREKVEAKIAELKTLNKYKWHIAKTVTSYKNLR